MLDPIFSLRCVVTIEPGESVLVAYSTAFAATREEALAAAQQFMDLHSRLWPEWEGVCEMRPMFGFEAR